MLWISNVVNDLLSPVKNVRFAYLLLLCLLILLWILA